LLVRAASLWVRQKSHISLLQQSGFVRTVVARASGIDRGEEAMRLQALAPSNVRFEEDRKLSFWQRLFEKIMVARQQKANEYIAEYLQRHEEYREK
jgi:hypothetical protein